MTRTSASRLKHDGITRHGLALKDERDALYARARGRCEACGELVEHTLFQVAHRIAQTQANYKRYGHRVIDHRINKAVTHPGRCNDRMNCGFNPEACAEIVRRIEEEDEQAQREQEYAEDVARQEALDSLYTYDEGGFCDGFTRY